MQKVRHLTECKTDLNFSPLDHWPAALPLFSKENQLLCGFDRVTSTETLTVSTSPVYELEAPLVDTIKALYPKLTLPELARLSQKLDQPEDLFSKYGYRYTSELKENISYLVELPLTLQNWLSEKDLAPRELERLLPLSSDSKPLMIETLQFCIEKRFGKNVTLQICEWTQELSHLGRGFEEAFRDYKNSDAFFLKLKSLRFPQVTISDSAKERELRALSWPSKTDAKWVRYGDLAGIEIQIKAHSELEIEKQITALQNLKTKLKNLWRVGP